MPPGHQEAFTGYSVDWLKSTFGEGNIVAVDMHMDEKTPHLHAVIIPMKDGKLNARHFTGGREKMTGLQDSYAEKMQSLQLERGVKTARQSNRN